MLRLRSRGTSLFTFCNRLRLVLLKNVVVTLVIRAQHPAENTLGHLLNRRNVMATTGYFDGVLI